MRFDAESSFSDTEITADCFYEKGDFRLRGLRYNDLLVEKCKLDINISFRYLIDKDDDEILEYLLKEVVDAEMLIEPMKSCCYDKYKVFAANILAEQFLVSLSYG